MQIIGGNMFGLFIQGVSISMPCIMIIVFREVY